MKKVQKTLEEKEFEIRRLENLTILRIRHSLRGHSTKQRNAKKRNCYEINKINKKCDTNNTICIKLKELNDLMFTIIQENAILKMKF